MKDEKKLCKDLLEQYEIVVNELSNLEENEFVKKYVMLMKLKSELDSRKQELYNILNLENLIIVTIYLYILEKQNLLIVIYVV